MSLVFKVLYSKLEFVIPLYSVDNKYISVFIHISIDYKYYLQPMI